MFNCKAFYLQTEQPVFRCTETSTEADTKPGPEINVLYFTL